MKKPERSRPKPVDMSSAAVDRRLREVSELRRLCLSLACARRLGPVHRRPSRRGGGAAAQ